ncbi:MAG: CTAG/PCC1 family protein [Thaumarchaeota archaeon]|nr:CTAG/PCC1 family protein [Nitrososphaerota archaeon]
MSKSGTFMEAELVMHFEEERIAELVMKALAPDNEPLPKGLSIEMRREGNAVIFKILCSRSVKSLLATLDDILAMSILTLKCLKVTSK